jgi:lauroyl/myristoyl acyltransferase
VILRDERLIFDLAGHDGFSNMKDFITLLRFFIVRRLERILPIEILYWVLTPPAFLRALSFRRKPPIPLPDFFGAKKTVRSRVKQDTIFYLNRAIEFFPERLPEARWKSRCRIVGLERLQHAQQGGRPLVLVFCHFGPLFLMPCWLRAHGVRVAALVWSKSHDRNKLKRLQDEVALFPEIPKTFHPDQLREMVRFLSPGNSLLIAIDYPTGKCMDLPLRDGWTFHTATGAIRLASDCHAELVPCTIINEGRWRFRIEIGRPVPAEWLGAETDLARIGKYLLDEMFPHFQRHPEQSARKLIESLERNPNA